MNLFVSQETGKNKDGVWANRRWCDRRELLELNLYCSGGIRAQGGARDPRSGHGAEQARLPGGWGSWWSVGTTRSRTPRCVWSTHHGWLWDSFVCLGRRVGTGPKSGDMPTRFPWRHLAANGGH